ncbi:MAG: transglutaminase domain-containing protein [Clostridia bacterium]|nr:transglutaminase domain-containing protein [Clostridia bacterium]
MQYDKYYKRISVIANIFKTIKHFRALIISVVSVIIALTSGYLGTQGIVYDSEECPASFEYGAEFTYEANALFQDVVYEFSSDKDFTTVLEEMPRFPGEYYVRAVSTSSFGNPRYGDIHAFTILPKKLDVKVKQQSILYGDTPSVTASLIKGDEIYCTDYIYEDISRVSTTVQPVKASIIITDSEGNDITWAYDVNPVSSKIDLTTREITVTVGDASDIYDALPFMYDGYELSGGTLAYGNTDKSDKLIATFKDSITNVGEIKNIPSFRVVNAEGKDVSAHYNIRVREGTLTVNKRPVQINIGNAEFEYDGAEHKYTDFEIDSTTQMVEGHTVTVSESVGITDSGSATNIISFIITDSEGKDVTSNYSIFLTEATITVTPRKITVSTGDGEWVYDGAQHENKEYEIVSETGLVEGDSSHIASNTVVKDANGDGVANEILLSIKKSDNTDNTKNYEITYEKGNLKVNKKPISISTEDHIFEYNGEENSWEVYAISADTPLVNGHSSSVNTRASVKNVSQGQIDNTITLTIKDGADTDVTVNYEISTISLGKLSVTPRPITVTPVSCEKIYDGTPLTGNGITVDNIVSGHVGGATVLGSQTNVGVAESTVDSATFTVAKGEEAIDISNYHITYMPGTLTVTKRDVKIITSDASWVYDGAPHFSNDHEVSTDTPIVEGHTTVVTANISVTSVSEGVVENTLTVDILDSDENNVTENYEISYEYGNLTINPRPVSVISQDKSWVYDGASHQWTGHDVSADTPLVDGHYTEALTGAEIVNVLDGPKDNDITVAIKNDLGIDMMENYIISYTPGTLTVTPRPVRIITDSKSWMYDTGSHSWSGHTVSSETPLVSGHVTSAFSRASVSTVGEGEVDNILEISIFSGNINVTSNYDITYECGKLSIYPRPISVTTGTASWTYDGEVHSYTEHTVNCDYGFIASHYSEVSTFTEIVNTWDGPTDNILTVIMKDADGSDVTENYAITYNYGTLSITPRPVTIVTSDSNWTYDGEAHSSPEHYVHGDTPLVEGHTTEATDCTEITNVWDGPTPNILVVKIKNADGENMTDNYSIAYENGTLTIDPRPVTIVTEDKNWTYDGETHSWTGHKVSEQTPLVVGHHTEVVSYTSVTNVWDSGFNYLTVEIKDSANSDMTPNYIISYEYGTLTVDPRPITVITYDSAWIYDGIAHSNAGHHVSENTPLVSGHTTQASGWATITDVLEGPKDNTATITVLDSGENDVTENYSISLDCGALTIIPKPLHISTGEYSWVYDGEEHFCTNHTVDPSTPLVSGHTTSVNEYAVITNVSEGPKDNILDILVIEELTGADKTSNYDISYTEGKLTVTRRPITVLTGSNSWEYDGEPHSERSGEVTSELKLVDGHRFSAEEWTEITNVGTCENILVLKVVDDNFDYSNNYDISYVNGQLEIYKREINVIADYGSKDYDGTPLTAPGVTTERLLPIHSLTATTSGSQTNAGVSPNVVVPGSVEITDAQGNDVSGNYNVTLVDNWLEVFPRPITITSADDTKEYDGTPLTNSTHTASENAMVLDHTYTVSVVGTGTNAGLYENTIVESSFRVVDGQGNDVTYNYAPSYVLGTLEITPIPIKITTGSAHKLYDGTPLTCDEHSITSEKTLLAGHTYTVTVNGTMTRSGHSPNTVDTLSLSITDAQGHNMNMNYDVTFEFGDLFVVPYAVIKVETGSAEKEYDGEPLTNDQATWTVIDGAFCEGHGIASLIATGTITNPGIVYNTYEIIITDGDGNDVSAYYMVEHRLGSLVVIGDDEGEGSGGGGGGEGSGGGGGSGGGSPDIDDSGNIGGSDSSDGEGDPVLAIEIKSSVSGSVYLKFRSCKNYTGTKWEMGTPYHNLLDDKYSYDYLTGIALQSSGVDPATALIKLHGTQYYLPYYYAYGDYNYNIQTNDVINTGDIMDMTVAYYPYSGYGKDLTVNLGDYSDEELAYREFVYANYLSVDAETEAYLLSVIAEQGFDADDEDIISLVEAYIEASGTYNMDYNKAMNDESNMVVAFLDTYKEGVCRHFASSATLMYRALGIPARYVEGYVGETTAGEWAEIYSTNAHAWTEVYIDGIGWIVVDCTPSMNGGGGSGGGSGDGSGDGSGEGDEKIRLELTPTEVSKGYDGTPLYASNEVKVPFGSVIEELLKKGYTYEAVITGSQIEIGESPSTIESFILYDSEGRDVTDQFELIFHEGVVKVTKTQIVITLYSMQKYYDGTPLSYGTGDYYISSIPDGLRVEFELSGSLTEAGELSMEYLEELPIAVYDSEGNDVTDNYYIKFEGDLLRVDRNRITIRSASETKKYDGTPLTNESVILSKGSLVEGHTLVAAATGTITVAGTTENVILEENIAILDAEGNDVTANYEIETIFGELTVLN